MSPRVSVVIRTYNRAHLLGEAIESVLSQSWRDLELIVVDDGSTDSTPALLEQYGNTVRPIFLGRTANPAAVFNAGIRVARGEFVAFLDSDDVWLPDKLRQQVAALDRQSRFGFAYGNVRLLYPDGRLSAPVLVEDQIVTGSVVRAMVRSMCVHTSTVLMRREIFQRVGYVDENNLVCEEFFFFLKVALVAEAVCIPEPVTLIRQHSGQHSGQLGLESYRAAIEALDGLLHEPGLHRDVRQEATRSIARYHTHLARHLITTGRLAEGRRHVILALRRQPLYRPAWGWALRGLLARHALPGGTT